MTLPTYLVALKLSTAPVDYDWNTVLFNTFWAVTDEDSPRLAKALQLVNAKATFALGVACSEWTIARVEGHTDTTDALLRIEAAWAAAIDPRYAKLPPPPPSPPSAPQQFASPLRLAMKLTAYAHERFNGDAEDVTASTQGLAMLVDHIAGRNPAYSPWLTQSLRKCHEHHPPADISVDEEAPVPRELFNPDFTWSEEAEQVAVERFVESLNPVQNPYLRSSEEMVAAGFEGVPYGRRK